MPSSRSIATTSGGRSNGAGADSSRLRSRPTEAKKSSRPAGEITHSMTRSPSPSFTISCFTSGPRKHAVPGNDRVSLLVHDDASPSAETDLELDLVAVRMRSDPPAGRNCLVAHRQRAETGVGRHELRVGVAVGRHRLPPGASLPGLHDDRATACGFHRVHWRPPRCLADREGPECMPPGYRPRTTSRPQSSKSSFAREIRPARCSSSVRSRATTCDTFATESLGRLVIPAVNSTLHGASAHRRLLVSGMQTTVATRLRFRASPWTTMTGRRKPGPEPVGGGNSAQHTSP